MIGHYLNKIKEHNIANEMLLKLKQEEKQCQFYVLKIGKTEIKTTSEHRLEEYKKLYGVTK